ncbi:MAG: CBS domain-containing protein, partial [Desulfurococcales archaeon]|nr:CBS domain-containing protein [Desulfurococcales archaeon]
ERDLLYALADCEKCDVMQVWMYMTENPVTVKPSTPITEAIDTMREAGVRHLPVVDSEGKPLGMLSMRDVVEALMLVIGALARGA